MIQTGDAALYFRVAERVQAERCVLLLSLLLHPAHVIPHRSVATRKSANRQDRSKSAAAASKWQIVQLRSLLVKILRD